MYSRAYTLTRACACKSVSSCLRVHVHTRTRGITHPSSPVRTRRFASTAQHSAHQRQLAVATLPIRSGNRPETVALAGARRTVDVPGFISAVLVLLTLRLLARTGRLLCRVSVISVGHCVWVLGVPPLGGIEEWHSPAATARAQCRKWARAAGCVSVYVCILGGAVTECSRLRLSEAAARSVAGRSRAGPSAGPPGPSVAESRRRGLPVAQHLASTVFLPRGPPRCQPEPASGRGD